MDLYRFRAFLDNEECEQAKRFRLEKDQRRFIARRGKLRQLLSQLLDCEPSQVPLSRNSFGKPFVRKTDLRFNASHSRNIALIAVAHGQEVGCDIEARDARFASQVDFERIFSTSEARELRCLDPSEQVEAFFNCWTRKEAYIKALGCGVSRPLGSFDVSLTPGKPAELLRGCSGWSVASFEPVPGFQAAVVVAAADWWPNFQSISQEFLRRNRVDELGAPHSVTSPHVLETGDELANTNPMRPQRSLCRPGERSQVSSVSPPCSGKASR